MSISRLSRFAASLLLAASLLGCDGAAGRLQHVATQWHRQDLEAQLGRWLAVAPSPSGLLVGKFDRQWQPLPAKGGELTTHSRLVYTLAIGYETSGDRRYLDEARRGADFLLAHFRDPQYGGFFSSVDADGQLLNGNKNTYGHAFALLALAHVARVSGEERYRQAALAAWDDINRHLRDDAGGFRGNAPRDFAPSGGLRSQNPVMHMFEALLALIDATGDPRAVAGAQSVGHFVLYKLLAGQADGGAYIPEWYDAQWQPLPSRDKGGYIDVGHQFEWSHLLAGAERRGLSGLYGAAGERVLQWGLQAGYDEHEGGIFNRVYPDGTVDRSKYWWPQAEALRALLVAAAGSERRDLWRRYEQTLELVRAEFVDPVAGGWRTGDRRLCETGRCGDEQPDPYHMVGLHVTALQLAARD